MSSLGEGIKGLLNPSRACHKNSQVTTRIRGTDMVTDIAATSTFGVTSFRVNPGNSLLFPRLSAPSKIFEKYDVRSLTFKVRPTSAATRSGAVVLLFETDTYDSIPTTKEEMLNHQNSCRGLPWDAFDLRVSARDLHPRPQMFIRPEEVAPSDYDARLDDLGELHIGAYVDSETPIVIGELWVEYDIELISPAVHSTEPTARGWSLTAPNGTYANDVALVTAMVPSATNTMDEVLSILSPATGGGHLLSLGPLEAIIRFYSRSNPASTFSALPAFLGDNGAVLRNSSFAGDLEFNNPGSFSEAQNLISMPGLGFPPGQTAADISALPNVAWVAPLLSAGTFLGCLLSLSPVRSGISSVPFPPMSLLKKSQLRTAWHKHLSTGRFHNGLKDCLATLGTKTYATGRGCVTSDWILTKPVEDLDDEKRRRPEPKRCEGACNSVQKFTFK